MTVPDVSIVIPIHNEEGILHSAVVDLRERLGRLEWRYEIVLAENGSRDGTAALAAELRERYSELDTFSIAEPNYGAALAAGIARARAAIVICEEIDLCDVDFHQRARAVLDADEADLVVGSKLLRGASDERPLFRHVASLVYNGLLRAAFGFRGTDTHGLKAFRRDPVAAVASRCETDRNVFASELVLRCYEEELRVIEIPVRLVEKRLPSVNLLKRVPSVLANLVKLRRALR